MVIPTRLAQKCYTFEQPKLGTVHLRFWRVLTAIDRQINCWGKHSHINPNPFSSSLYLLRVDRPRLESFSVIVAYLEMVATLANTRDRNPFDALYLMKQ